MRFAVIVLACVLAVANAQLSAQAKAQNTGKYVPENDGRYQYNNRYNNQYNRYEPYNRYNNQYNQYDQYNRRNSYYNNNYYNRNQNYGPYTPFVTSTPFPRVTVTPAPTVVKVTSAPAASAAPVAVSAPAVTVAPFVPVAPVEPVAPVVPAFTASKIAVNSPLAETVRYGNEINPDGSYSYFFETNNGIAAQAQGTPRNFGGDPPVVPDVAQGAFSWYSPEGQLISINWTADENGYQPTGDAIPQPPPLPDQIARAFAYIARTAPVPAVAKAASEE